MRRPSTPAATPIASPNRVRDLTSDPANNSTFGTLDFRHTFTNNTGGNLTRLRFRIVDLTTFPATSQIADLRPRTSTSVVVTVDRPPCGSGTSNITVRDHPRAAVQPAQRRWLQLAVGRDGHARHPARFRRLGRRTLPAGDPADGRGALLRGLGNAARDAERDVLLHRLDRRCRHGAPPGDRGLRWRWESGPWPSCARAAEPGTAQRDERAVGQSGRPARTRRLQRRRHRRYRGLPSLDRAVVQSSLTDRHVGGSR